MHFSTLLFILRATNLARCSFRATNITSLSFCVVSCKQSFLMSLASLMQGGHLSNSLDKDLL